jgi:hypothetical protein
VAKKARAKTAQWNWVRHAIGTEGAPVLVADLEVYEAWRGNQGASPTDYQRLVMDHGYGDPAGVVPFGAKAVGLIDSDGGGPVDIGWSDDETLIVQYVGDYEEQPKRLTKLVKAIESGKLPEFLVGEIELSAALVIADSALEAPSGSMASDEAGPVATNRFRVPRRGGRYVLVEGRYEEDDGLEATWCRLVPRGKGNYRERPKPTPDDPVALILERLSFEDPKEEARSLEAALELVRLGRPEVALEICAKASPARRVLAAWTRIFALAAQRDEKARAEAMDLARSWLSPATSADATNQALPRASVLRAIEAALGVEEAAALREMHRRVSDAPEPEVFVPDGGDFF